MRLTFASPEGFLCRTLSQGRSSGEKKTKETRKQKQRRPDQNALSGDDFGSLFQRQRIDAVCHVFFNVFFSFFFFFFFSLRLPTTTTNMRAGIHDASPHPPSLPPTLPPHLRVNGTGTGLARNRDSKQTRPSCPPSPPSLPPSLPP